jgi:hypothetical protein
VRLKLFTVISASLGLMILAELPASAQVVAPAEEARVPASSLRSVRLEAMRLRAESPEFSNIRLLDDARFFSHNPLRSYAELDRRGLSIVSEFHRPKAARRKDDWKIMTGARYKMLDLYGLAYSSFSGLDFDCGKNFAYYAEKTMISEITFVWNF